MKTAIRTQIAKSSNYSIMHIEILSPRYGGNDYFEPIGTITFQQTVGEERWYAMNFVVHTSNIKHLEKVTKLAKFISKNSDYNSQPDDIKKLIGADEHVVYECDFVSKSKIGEKLFKIVVEGNHYTNIIAKTEAEANRILKKKNIANAKLEFLKVVVL